MARVHGVAGEEARVRRAVLGAWPLALGAAGVGASLALAAGGSVVWGLAALGASAAVAVVGVRAALRRVGRCCRDARGEERVAGILRSLPDDYHVYIDWTGGGVHADCMVVGPAGFYILVAWSACGAVTVEGGRVLLDGRPPEPEPLASAWRAARELMTALRTAGWGGAITPVLVAARDGFSAHVAELDDGAVVINAADLRRGFDAKRVVVTPSELVRLVRLLG